MVLLVASCEEALAYHAYQIEVVACLLDHQVETLEERPQMASQEELDDLQAQEEERRAVPQEEPFQEVALQTSVEVNLSLVQVVGLVEWKIQMLLAWKKKIYDI
jgi:hypothetical protein